MDAPLRLGTLFPATPRPGQLQLGQHRSLKWNTTGLITETDFINTLDAVRVSMTPATTPSNWLTRLLRRRNAARVHAELCASNGWTLTLTAEVDNPSLLEGLAAHSRIGYAVPLDALQALVATARTLGADILPDPEPVDPEPVEEGPDEQGPSMLGPSPIPDDDSVDDDSVDEGSSMLDPSPVPSPIPDPEPDPEPPPEADIPWTGGITLQVEGQEEPARLVRLLDTEGAFPSMVPHLKGLQPLPADEREILSADLSDLLEDDQEVEAVWVVVSLRKPQS